MRKRGKIDANQPVIVRDLRKVGASVCSLSDMGNGCPDLIVGFRGKNYLIEVKDGDRKPSERKLTDDERAWHGGWVGQVAVVENTREALAVIGAGQ